MLGVGLLIDRIAALRTTRASARQGPPPREKIIASLGGRLVEAHERGWLGKVKGLQTSLAAEGASFAGAGTGCQRVRMANLTPTCDQHLWKLTRCGSLMASR